MTEMSWIGYNLVYSVFAVPMIAWVMLLGSSGQCAFGSDSCMGITSGIIKQVYSSDSGAPMLTPFVTITFLLVMWGIAFAMFASVAPAALAVWRASESGCTPLNMAGGIVTFVIPGMAVGYWMRRRVLGALDTCIDTQVFARVMDAQDMILGLVGLAKVTKMVRKAYRHI